MKSFTCITSNDVIISTRDRNDTAVLMHINFTELKSEIIASQINNASQRNNTSQSLTNVLVIKYTVSCHKYTT